MDIWTKYEECDQYLQKKQITKQTNEQWNFYNDKQWEGLESGGEVLPFFNFIKPILKYKVSTVCQNNITANYSDLLNREEYDAFYKGMNESFAANWERANMDRVSWQAVKTGAIEGDSYTYFGNENMKDIDVLGETEVLFGDEQMRDLQSQPYIMIRERLSVSEIRNIARENGLSDSEINSITGDADKDYLVGNKDDVDENGKATCVRYYEKIDGVVHMARACRTCEFVPLHPVKRTVGKEYSGEGLKYYPIVQFRWDDLPNNARGLSEVRIHIPNQIKENQVLAQRAITVAQCAYPMKAYDSTAVMNPEALDTVGGIIEVQGSIGKVTDMVGYLNPATISNDATQLSEDLREVSRELAGASETTLGQIDPTRVAASAITALNQNASVNINEQIAKYVQWVEDIARLWLPLQKVFAPEQLTDSGLTIEQIDELEPDIRIDVSQDTAWTKEAMKESLDMFLDKGHITFEEYVNVLPANSPVPVNDLKRVLQNRSVNNGLPDMQEGIDGGQSNGEPNMVGMPEPEMPEVPDIVQ